MPRLTVDPKEPALSLLTMHKMRRMPLSIFMDTNGKAACSKFAKIDLPVLVTVEAAVDSAVEREVCVAALAAEEDTIVEALVQVTAEEDTVVVAPVAPAPAPATAVVVSTMCRQHRIHSLTMLREMGSRVKLSSSAT